MFLTIRNIPIKSWSSKKPLNLKPKFPTFILLCIGLSFFGLGEGLLLVSTTGNSPWSVLAEGFSKKVDISIGLSTLVISVFVLLLWFPLRQKPGMGTILNILIIAAVIDITLFVVSPPVSIFSKYLLAIISVLLVGLGSGIYLIANLGPGPRDGLMTGLTKKTHFPIASIRATIEISAVIFGWYLGGTVGLGTLIFAFGIGPAVALGIYFVDKLTK